ncbi:hypothetical protein [Candidatus Neptunichlamydia sp. REUL1]|uniref:hypothetical protein n=1 Tax=Candidatus Neptunichlamydia sp. REUL1 TaxID=3064277 RepID=UPI002931A9BB|nr:hypothetical protein [Candidatus Neptunochlamydia sp. REUL1]
MLCLGINERILGKLNKFSINKYAQGKCDKLPEFQQGLEEIVREGARKILHQVIESEVEEFIKRIRNA